MQIISADCSSSINSYTTGGNYLLPPIKSSKPLIIVGEVLNAYDYTLKNMQGK